MSSDLMVFNITSVLMMPSSNSPLQITSLPFCPSCLTAWLIFPIGWPIIIWNSSFFHPHPPLPARSPYLLTICRFALHFPSCPTFSLSPSPVTSSCPVSLRYDLFSQLPQLNFPLREKANTEKYYYGSEAISFLSHFENHTGIVQWEQYVSDIPPPHNNSQVWGKESPLPVSKELLVLEEIELLLNWKLEVMDV